MSRLLCLFGRHIKRLEHQGPLAAGYNAVVCDRCPYQRRLGQ